MNRNLLDSLKYEKNNKISGGIYHKLQVKFTYNSNNIEGSKLSEEQTRLIFETNTIGLDDANSSLNVDDIIETLNHFQAIDKIIDLYDKDLTEEFIKNLHKMLKSGTSDSKKDWFNVGEYKAYPNEVGGYDTTLPEDVAHEMKKLLDSYEKREAKTIEDIIDFHYNFEKIHPFQDGNGRVGRLIILKECLKNNIAPFIIGEDLKFFYYRGLSNYKKEKEFLLDTCLSAQDRFKRYLDYFKISYNNWEFILKEGRPPFFVAWIYNLSAKKLLIAKIFTGGVQNINFIFQNILL